MKILHINFSDTSGGAAIAVGRIHNLLLKNNHESKILVCEKISNDDSIIYHKSTLKLIRSLIYDSLSRKILKLFKKTNKETSNSLSLYPTGLHKKINSLNPDIVNLHWLGNSMISIKEISKIKSPIVWTLHDMWPMCGLEHYSTNKKYFINENKSPKQRFNLDDYVWGQKKKYFKKINKIICTSNWMYQKAKNSYIFNDKKIKEIPITLDTKFWKPQNKIASKKFFKINSNEQVIAFGADNFLKNNRKGFLYFSKSVEVFLNNSQYKIIIFGESSNLPFEKNYSNIINLGYVKDKYTLRMIFSATDVMVVPSLIESFGMVALESLHCETPCVVFENTGTTSIVNHKVNGYIAKYKSSEDLKLGINWVLNNTKIVKSNIKRTLGKFDNKEIISQYIKFLQE